MSLETEIVKLTSAIEALTAKMCEAPKIKAKSKAEPLEEVLDAPDTVELRLLAKEAIKAGADRKAIKKLITKLGGETISDLDAAALATLKEQLEAL
jgi:tRNA(Ile2) C34 agmatinyltransferase TiaS